MRPAPPTSRVRRSTTRTAFRGRGSPSTTPTPPSPAVAVSPSADPPLTPSPPVGPYTPLVRAGDWLVASGQLGLVDGSLVHGGVAAETRQALANLDALLAAEDA